MRIPNGPSFGNEVARYPQTPVAGARELDGGIGAAVNRVGEGLQGIALEGIHQEARQQQMAAREEEQRQLVAQRAQAALVLAQTQNDAFDAHDEVARGVADGSIAPDKAESELNTRIAKVRDERFQPLTEEQRGAIGDNLLRTTGTLSRSLRGVVVKRQQSDTAATIDQFGEQVQRDVMRIGPAAAADKFDALVDFAAPGAGLTPAGAAKLKQANREKFHASYFDAVGVDALTRGDVQRLGTTLEQLRGPDGEALDPTKRTELEHRIFGYQQSLLAKQDRAKNEADRLQLQRENAAVDVFNKAADLSLAGQYFSPDFIRDLTSTSAGTSMQGEVQKLIASQRQVAGFASLSAPARAAELEQMRAQGANPAEGVDPLGAKLIAAATAMDAKLRQGVKDNPWQTAQSAGVIQNAPVIDPTNASSALDVVRQRMQMIGKVETWAGEKISPLQPAEAETVGKLLRAMPPDQAATLLGNLGATIGDKDRAAAVAKQFHDKDGTLGLSMAYANTGTTEGRLVAELVLRGDQALKDKLVKPDATAGTGWEATISKTIRGAYSNKEIEDEVVKAAFLIHAAKNGEDIDNAIRLATGGGIVDFNGARVPMPAGYAADGGQSGAERRFRKAIESIPPEQLMPQATDGNVYANGIPIRASDFLASLPQAQLVHAGAGVYNVKAGNSLVTNRDGRRITIRLP